jgi:hypothetical protein
MSKKPRHRNADQSRFKVWEIVGGIVEKIVVYGSVLGIAVCFYLSIDTLAGRDTNAKIDLSANLQVCEAPDWPYWLAGLCFAAALAGVAYGYAQLQSKRETIAALTTYTTKLEALLDVNRTSSGISKDGSTNPGD